MRAFHRQLWQRFEIVGEGGVGQIEAVLDLEPGHFAELRQRNVLDLELLLRALDALDVIPLQFFDEVLQIERYSIRVCPDRMCPDSGFPESASRAHPGVISDLETLAVRAWSGLAEEARRRWEELSGEAAETIWREAQHGICEQIAPGEMVCRFHLTLNAWLGADGEELVEVSLGLDRGALSAWRQRNELELGLLFKSLDVLAIDSLSFIRQAIQGLDGLGGGASLGLEKWQPKLAVEALDLGTPSDLHQLLDAFIFGSQVVWLDRRTDIYGVLQHYSGYVERFRQSIGDLQTLAQQTDGWGAACERHGTDPLNELGQIISGVHADADEAWLVYCFLDEAIPLTQLNCELHPVTESYLQLEMFVADKRRMMGPSSLLTDWLLEPSG